MPKFKTIAFYTEDTPYEHEAFELMQNAKKFNIEVKIVPYPSTGEWVKNCAIKPSFILDEMEEDLKIPWFLYVDVDARFRKYPKRFDNFKGDIGVHFMRDKELLSGTIFLKNTPQVRELIKCWVLYQEANPRELDQRTLQHVLTTNHGLKVINLPPTYTQIFDTMKRCGRPVIEHMQASRRYKALVTTASTVNVPAVIGKSRIRRGYDGIYYITRRDPIAEAYLDKYCSRLENQLKWLPYTQSENLEELKSLFKDQSCYIVGKGPSLDKLRLKHFKDSTAPIIGLNEAVRVVEKLNPPNPLFGLQQDAKLQDTCYPEKASFFASVKTASWYAGRERVYIYDPRHYSLGFSELSVGAAIKIAQSLGAIHFTLISFDASVNGRLEYAKVIGYNAKKGGKLTRFNTHRSRINAYLAETPTKWLIPGASVE